MDAVLGQEKTMCSSISIHDVDRRESQDFKDSFGDIELSVPQLSACNSDVEGSQSIVNVNEQTAIEDWGTSVSTSVNKSVNRVTACSTAPASQSCTCVGCTDYNQPNQPLEVAQSKLIQSYAC